MFRFKGLIDLGGYAAYLQPIDAGIIHSFKAKYKREFCKHIIGQFDKGIDREK